MITVDDSLVDIGYQDYREELLERIRRLEAGRRGLEAEIAELREALQLLDRLDSYSDVDDDVSDSIGRLGDVLTSSVTGNETLFGTVERHIDEWRGSAADAFADRVIRIHDLLNKQSVYAAVLQEHLRQYAKLGTCARTATQQLTTAMVRAMEAIAEHRRQQPENALELLVTLATVTTSAAGKDVVGAGVAAGGYVITTTMIREKLTARTRGDVVAEIQRLARVALTSLSAAAAGAAGTITETVEVMRRACAETFPVRPASLDVCSPDFSYANFQYQAGISEDERRFLDNVEKLRDKLYPDESSSSRNCSSAK